MEILLVIFGVIGLALTILTYNAFVWGLVAHTMYGWFVLSAFPDATHFSILQFVGFSLFLSAIKPSIGESFKSEYEDNGKMWSKLLLTPWLVLLFAWFIHLFY